VRDTCKCIRLHTTEGEFDARTIILATGAGHAHLGVPGEEAFSGKGVSYCATCDGAFYRGKTVAVVGGGDVALEDAIYLSRFCEKVYLIHRRDEFRGARILQEELLSKENVEILYSHTVQEIIGNDQVTGVMLKDVKADKERYLPLDGVFIAIGIIPNTELVESLVECDKGYVIAGEDCVTSMQGIFVAGDARKKPLRQIITAVADGANAVASISAYLAFQGK
jgi:thioredoxin reductase (NADPH)